MGKHRGSADPRFAPGSTGRAKMTDEEAQELEEAFPPRTDAARVAADVKRVDQAYDRRGKPKK
jgi:hypothetical protein